MGVRFARILDGFEGPFAPVGDLEAPPAAAIAGASNPAGYLVSHEMNDALHRLQPTPGCRRGRLLAEGGARRRRAQVRRRARSWVPASAAAREILERGAIELGVPALAVSRAPKGAALKLRPVRIGLYDQYGGLMPTGWDRWLFEQYEFPYERVYPKDLDAGNLKSRFDVLVFPDGAFTDSERRYDGGEPARRRGHPGGVPRLARAHRRRTSRSRRSRRSWRRAASVVAVGSSTGMGHLLGVPVRNYLTRVGADGAREAAAGGRVLHPGLAAAGEGRSRRSPGLRHARADATSSTTTTRSSTSSRRPRSKG